MMRLLLRVMMVTGAACAVVFEVIGILCRCVAAPARYYHSYDRHGRY